MELGNTMQDQIGKFWLISLRSIIEKCFEYVPGLMDTYSGVNIVAIKPDGDPTIEAEVRVEDIASDILFKQNIPLILYSEERGYLLNDSDAKYVVLLDPIDATFRAVRKLPGSCIAISVHEADSMEPVAAMVGDYHNRDIYWATSEGAFKNGRGIHPSAVTTLDKAYISTCYGKTSRIGSILEMKGLVGTVFWIETTGGILSMVFVGTGQVDAYLDLMLGYKTYDFAAGAYIAKMAGAVVTDEYGDPLRYPHDPTVRCKFIIAANEMLHKAIMRASE